MCILIMIFGRLLSIYADSEYSNGYNWRYAIDGDEARIYGMTVWSSEFCGEVPAVSPNPVGALTIPSVLGGKPMTYIGNLAFTHCDDLTLVTIPDCVTKIDCRSFAYCDRSPARIDFKGKPPVVLGYYDTIISTVGTYQPEYEAEWKAVMDYNGRWYGLKMQMFGASHVITFNPNGGKGTIDVQTFEEGQEQKLSKNTYCKDGCLFQGWAVTADGEVIYKDEAEIIVDSDMTLYAVWKSPALTLTAESANWSSGSITLRCEDSDTSGAAHEYTLEYKNASGIWEEVDGAKNVAATKGQDANGQEVLIAKLTDNTFWSRLGGLPPVEYRVKDENGRVSEGCVTRTRYGLAVGFSKYGTSATPHSQSLADAMLFKTLALSKASCLNVELLKNNEATISGIHGAFVRWSGIVKPGDVFFFYIATHGGYNGTRAGLTAYDGLYEVSSLVSDSSLMPAGSLFLGVVMSCHSRAMVDYSDSDPEKFWYQVRNGLAQCRANSAWISSCGYDESSYNSPTSSQTAFGEWFLKKGWQNGFADAALHGLDYSGGNGDGSLTLLELANYAHAFSKGISDDNPSEMYWENGNNTLLGMVVLDASCHYQNIEAPNLPTNVSASQGDTKIDLSWAKVGSATSYRVYRYPLDLPSEFKWIGISGESRYKDATTTLKKEYGYQIRAVNPIGVSDLSSVAIGSRGTSKFIEFLNSFFGITTASADEYDAMEKTTAANGCRTVGECYELGIDPEDPNDDLKIAEFKMKDGKPEITLNHTKDGSGNSFEDRVKILGKAELSDAEWQEVPPEGNPAHRFFKVGVEMP